LGNFRNPIIFYQISLRKALNPNWFLPIPGIGYLRKGWEPEDLGLAHYFAGKRRVKGGYQLWGVKKVDFVLLYQEILLKKYVKSITFKDEIDQLKVLK